MSKTARQISNLTTEQEVVHPLFNTDSRTNKSIIHLKKCILKEEQIKSNNVKVKY